MPARVNTSQITGVCPEKRKAEKDLNAEGFLNLFTQMLSHQSPWEPMKDGEVFSQMSQYGLTQSLSEASQAFKTAQGSGLIGKTVEAISAENQKVGREASSKKEKESIRGVVESVHNQNGNLFLSIKNSEGKIVKVKMSSWKEISETPK